ncbi:MAG TPA: hypothetical protein DIU15_01295 [Deltaproteobacteria bacterium]|nr:hypothetical protein [Deltaproteobacteria bacterium]HCP44661.1 hypothetical protein [Deltaproteobacteria bacterium]
MGAGVLAGLSLAILAGLGIFSWLVSRAHTVVQFSDHGPQLVRGYLPPGLLSDLQDIDRSAGGIVGRLSIRGQGDTLELNVSGMGDREEQRIRNVVMLRRRQLRRPR